MTEFDLMQVALERAAQGDLRTHPNPKVGCAILTRDGRVFSAHHVEAGKEHAEVLALNEVIKAGVSPEGAVVAVTLEPCSHFGKTPPCADALIRAKVRKVLVAMLDPFPKVSGSGIQKLREAGIQVEVAAEDSAARAQAETLNIEWLFAQRQRRPFVRVKMVCSLDGMWTAHDGSSKWISSPEARDRGHQLRSLANAIVTGRKTLEKDDPEFTVRLSGYQGPQPRVCVLSKAQSSVSFSLHNFKVAPRARMYCPNSLSEFLGQLFQEGYFSVLVEAGPDLTHGFLNTPGLVQELHLTLAPKFLGGEGRRFDRFFGNGSLPGLEWNISKSEQLNSGDVILQLHPKSTE